MHYSTTSALFALQEPTVRWKLDENWYSRIRGYLGGYWSTWVEWTTLIGSSTAGRSSASPDECKHVVSWRRPRQQQQQQPSRPSSSDCREICIETHSQEPRPTPAHTWRTCPCRWSAPVLLETSSCRQHNSKILLNDVILFVDQLSCK